MLGHQSIAHGEYLTLRYQHDKEWQYRPELNIARVRSIVFIDVNDSIDGHTVYVAGGFNVNPTNHKPFILPDLHLFNQDTQSWQYVTTIPNLKLTNELTFDDHKLHVSESIEIPGQIPKINPICSFDLQKLIWIDKANDTDNHNNKRKTIESISIRSSPSTSSFSFSPNVKRKNVNKTQENSQVFQDFILINYFNSKIVKSNLD